MWNSALAVVMLLGLPLGTSSQLSAGGLDVVSIASLGPLRINAHDRLTVGAEAPKAAAGSRLGSDASSSVPRRDGRSAIAPSHPA